MLNVVLLPVFDGRGDHLETSEFEAAFFPFLHNLTDFAALRPIVFNHDEGAFEGLFLVGALGRRG